MKPDSLSRYLELKRLQALGEISNLRTDVKFDLKVNGMLVGEYKPRFVYRKEGREVAEHCGPLNSVAEIKLSLLAAIYRMETVVT